MNEVHIKKIFYKDDFDFILSIVDKIGIDIGWPNFNWSARFWTSSKANAFVVSSIDGECHHCFPDDGRIHVVFDNHGLSFGDLFYELTLSIPSEKYADQSKDLHLTGKLPVKLTASCADADYTLQYREPGNKIPDLNIPGDGSLDADTISIIVNQAISRHNDQLKSAFSNENMTASDNDISEAAYQIFNNQ